jgi:hypothetical protein
MTEETTKKQRDWGFSKKSNVAMAVSGVFAIACQSAKTATVQIASLVMAFIIAMTTIIIQARIDSKEKNDN